MAERGRERKRETYLGLKIYFHLTTGGVKGKKYKFKKSFFFSLILNEFVCFLEKERTIAIVWLRPYNL